MGKMKEKFMEEREKEMSETQMNLEYSAITGPYLKLVAHIMELVTRYPNNMELGKHVRKTVQEFDSFTKNNG